jgi:hypothetical protein
MGKLSVNGQIVFGYLLVYINPFRRSSQFSMSATLPFTYHLEQAMAMHDREGGNEVIPNAAFIEVVEPNRWIALRRRADRQPIRAKPTLS